MSVACYTLAFLCTKGTLNAVVDFSLAAHTCNNRCITTAKAVNVMVTTNAACVDPSRNNNTAAAIPNAYYEGCEEFYTGWYGVYIILIQEQSWLLTYL
jgi:hypothetical protein